MVTREIDMRFSPISDPREKSPGAARTCSGAARCALRRGTHSLPKLRACPGMKGQLKQVAFKHRMENEAQGGGRTDHEAQRNQCGRGPCFWSPRRSRLGKNDPKKVLLLASAPGSWGTLQAETRKDLDQIRNQSLLCPCSQQETRRIQGLSHFSPAVPFIASSFCCYFYEPCCCSGRIPRSFSPCVCVCVCVCVCKEVTHN